MPTIRLFILITALAVSAYAVYNAGRKVKASNANETQMRQLQKNLTKENYSFMHRAVALDGRMKDKDQSGASVVVMDNIIIGEGVNRVNALRDPSAHAEVEAIRQAVQSLPSSSLKNASIYVTHRPCPMCLSLIYLMEIEKIYYRSSDENHSSAMDPIFNALGAPHHERPIPEVPIRMEQ
jgi:guanine deaminase